MSEIPFGQNFFYTPPNPGEISGDDHIGKGMAKLLTEVSQMQPDVIVFLDKAARQYAGIYSALVQTRFGNSLQDTIKFLNIGREIDPQAIEIKIGEMKRQVQQEGNLVYTFAQRVKGKKVLVVDDVVSSGETKGQADRVFSEVFEPSEYKFLPILDFSVPSISDQPALGVVEKVEVIGNVPVTLPFTVSYKQYLRRLALEREIAEKQQQLDQLTQKMVRQHKARPSADSTLLKLIEERDNIGVLFGVMLRPSQSIPDARAQYGVKRFARRSWREIARRIAPNIQQASN